MEDTILQFDGVSKLYMLGQVGSGTLARDLARWWKMSVLHEDDPLLRVGETNDRSRRGNSDCVWALKDISFDVRRGEVVGIIGRNGAGKSTLLKLLSRITSPTTGEIRARGRIASLLEVGTGFHNELTGRDNIYMNGSIMGMTRAEITRKLDEIVDFAGVERYLDTPVKRYSSGMFVRLGFAVAAFLEPEILVVDEVLAVGDAEFQRKAIGKMQSVSRSEGRTVLFVSHNMASIKSLCTRGIVLDNGLLTFDGSVSEAIRRYTSAAPLASADGKSIAECIGWKKSYIDITNIELNGTMERHSVIISGQETLDVTVEGRTSESFRTDLMVVLKTSEGTPLATLAEGHTEGRIEHIAEGAFSLHRRIVLPKILSSGDFSVDIFLHHPNTEWQMKAVDCAVLHADGSMGLAGKPLNIRENGLCGLETVE